MSKTHHFRILLWKNYTLKKRHYISTTCEILLPTLFAIAIAILRGSIDHNPDNIFVNTTYHAELSQLDLMNNFCQTFLTVNRSHYTVILYTPQNEATDTIIRNMNETYNKLIENMEWESHQNCSELQTSCTLGVWRPTETEEDMEEFAFEYFNERYTLNEPIYPNGALLSGIVFTSDMTPETSDGKLSYKIRFAERFLTDELFTTEGMSYMTYDYEQRFIGLQIMLDLAIIQFHTNQPPNIGISVQGFPYPPHEYNANFNTEFLYNLLLPQLVVLGFIFVIPSTLRILVNEKGTGVHELLTLMGLSKCLQWFGHFINCMMVLTISVTIVVVVFYIPFFGKESGAVFYYNDPTILWIMLWLFAAATTSFCFFISTIFQQPALAIPGGIAICIITHYPVILPYLETIENLNFLIKILICIVPNNAIHYGTRIASAHEINENGLRWSKLYDGVTESDDFGLYVVMLMLMFDACAYMILSMYLEKILPSTYGTRKVWYYIFLPSEWGIGLAKFPPMETWSFSFAYRQDPEAFEKEQRNAKVGIEIRKLRKEFNGYVAVAGTDLKIYEGQITALLGQNGAGKTTVLSMLIGMIAPTSGTAFVNGYNIRTQMEKVRTNLSYCPQHNMLFNQLSVKENLYIFRRLTGLSPKDAAEKTDEMLIKLRLERKENCLITALSGGEKRTVSLGCALIQDSKLPFISLNPPKVVILDEPTSGLDVDNRRMVWDLLLKFRSGRTIVLTTHFMEEADILGDRIAILDQGELMCVGSPIFLKNYYGTGYILKLLLDSNQNQTRILEAVQEVIPKATIIKRNTGYLRELLIAIPSTTTSDFPQLFLNLERKKTDFGIQNFSLAQTSMDDVFARVGEITANCSITDAINKTESTKRLNEVIGKFANNASAIELSTQCLWTLSEKKIIYVLRRPIILSLQVLISVVLLIVAILITNFSFTTPEQEEPPLIMKLASYNNPITAFASTEETTAQIYNEIVGSSAERVTNHDMEMYYSNVGKNDITTFRTRHIVGAEINATNIMAMYSTVAHHAISLSVNFAMSTVLRNLTRLPMTFEVTNHPFHNDGTDIRRMAHLDGDAALSFMILLPVGLSLLVSPFIILPVEERRTSAKHLQLMTGLDPVIYWLSFFVADFLFVAIVAAIMVTWFPILENYESFTSRSGAGVAFFIVISFGFQAIPFIYLISLTVKSVAGGLTVLTIYFILASIGVSFLVGWTQTSMADSVMYITWIPRLLPGFSVSNALQTFSYIAITNVHCKLYTEKQKSRFCMPGEQEWGYRYAKRVDPRVCCSECGNDGFPECFKPTEFLEWTTTASIFTHDVNLSGINQELLGMFLTGLLYFFLLIIIEKGIIQQFKEYLKYWFNHSEIYFQSTTEDDDVLEESDRIDQLVSNGKLNETDNEALVVRNFSKLFDKFPAVSNVSYGVQRGECFGLLGANGAGKTTIFRMLAGEIQPTGGNSFMPGINFEDDRKSFLRNLGYCPQFEGTVGYLTGNEILKVFGILRGIPRNNIYQEVEKWISEIGLSKIGKQECRHYSGGMKRRLGIAVAMIGDSKIILLDEPTTGVDPIARRQFRKTIQSLTAAGQSVVLISHSMEECEKLCNRQAIMVNGELQCLGDVEHLKEKYAEGFILTIKLKFDTKDISTSNLNNFKQKILNTFTPCTLNLLYQNILEFHLTNSNMSWSFIFAWMETLRYQFRDILEDYAVKQTTLEEVFLSFARQQTPERKSKKL